MIQKLDGVAPLVADPPCDNFLYFIIDGALQIVGRGLTQEISSHSQNGWIHYISKIMFVLKRKKTK